MNYNPGFQHGMNEQKNAISIFYDVQFDDYLMKYGILWQHILAQ